jgi:ribosomal protein S7
MPRKGPATKRQLVTDPVYGSPLVTSLVNKVLKNGKRSLAERIVYGALEGCRDKTGNDPVVTLKRALDNVKPTLEVRSRRVGGATYQVPVEVRASRSTTLARGAATRAARTPTRWPSPTRHSLTTAGSGLLNRPRIEDHCSGRDTDR